MDPQSTVISPEALAMSISLIVFSAMAIVTIIYMFMPKDGED